MDKGQVNKKRVNKQRMNKSRVIKAAIVIVILLMLVWAALRIFGKQSEPLLSREQAEQAVLNEYPGKVGSLELQAGQYIAELQTAQGWYKLKLDGATGEIISIVLLKHTVEPVVQPTPSVSGAPPGGAAASLSPSPPPTPSPSAQRVVSEDEAVRLALQEVPGKPDDVDTGINESGAYYLVEIKTSDGREAVVQVNAISGGIMSVTWEEPDGGNS